MSTQHTPGPWHVGTITSEQTTISLNGFKVKAMPISGSGRAIGCVYNGDARPERRLPDPTPEANARLIAAAPELLAALQAAEAVIRAYVDHESVEMCVFAEAGVDARAAIAKAVQP